MGRIKTIARRSFLVGSAAVVGGVAFGAYKLRETPQNPLIDDFGSPADLVTNTQWIDKF